MLGKFGARGTTKTTPSLRWSLEDLVSLVRRYVLEETVGPLRVLAKRVAKALLGALLYAIGSVIALVGLLRVLETETGTVFGGNWAFVPYLITAVGGALVVAVGLYAALRAVGGSRPGRV